MNFITLNNGVSMPQLGLGTFLIPNEKLSSVIGDAYKLGYRQFDTAWKYNNEEAIAEALRHNGIKREEVFLTTKVTSMALTLGHYHYGKKSFLNIPNGKSIRSVIRESFKNLKTDYIDLFLIHYPYPETDKIWEVLLSMYQEGEIRAIGVSNFLQPHLETLIDKYGVIPAVNQIELSPLNTQKELIRFCQAKGIAVEAMATFSHFRSVEPRAEIMKNEDLLAIANTHNKSVVQVVLRWFMQQDIIAIPKTWYLPHLKENIDIFDFELSSDEMRIIDSMDKGRFLSYDPTGQYQGFFRDSKTKDTSTFKNRILDLLDRIRY